jgi:hypothetical protein
VSVKQRWDDNTQNYRSKSKALKQFLDKHGQDWSQIELIS